MVGLKSFYIAPETVVIDTNIPNLESKMGFNLQSFWWEAKKEKIAQGERKEKKKDKKTEKRWK